MPHWNPLESNPETLTDYAERLGQSPGLFCFHDVLSFEDWAIEIIPKPVKAVLFLFPIKEGLHKADHGDLASDHSHGDLASSGLIFTRQKIGNACGTIALIHALANAPDLPLEAGSWISKFIVNPAASARAEYLESDTEIASLHESYERRGQSELTESSEEVDTHFICFVQIEGKLYELAGRNSRPLLRGEGLDEGELLRRVVLFVQEEYVQKDPEEMRFCLLALAPVE